MGNSSADDQTLSIRLEIIFMHNSEEEKTSFVVNQKKLISSGGFLVNLGLHLYWCNSINILLRKDSWRWLTGSNGLKQCLQCLLNMATIWDNWWNVNIKEDRLHNLYWIQCIIFMITQLIPISTAKVSNNLTHFQSKVCGGYCVESCRKMYSVDVCEEIFF